MLDTTAPTSKSPNDVSYQQFSTETIRWTLYDDVGGGYYKVSTGIREHPGITVVIPWTEWEHGDDVEVTVDTSIIGQFFYRIEFNDSRGNIGFFDTVFVNITRIEQPGGQDWVPTIIITSVAVGGVAVAGIIVYKKRKHK
jgi:hypothetical protein